EPLSRRALAGGYRPRAHHPVACRRRRTALDLVGRTGIVLARHESRRAADRGYRAQGINQFEARLRQRELRLCDRSWSAAAVKIAILPRSGHQARKSVARRNIE